ncbi:hypothetical protein [Mucilaginibacter sp.]|jgi:hypothetical protein|uniref:hypothetical protein n=1 Tax=Mucilaginibacter sp. TaxID=1882438 RepID=UPI00356A5940
MIKGSALYMVIVIALIIGIICSALVMVAYVYQAQYQKASRYSRLHDNLESAIALVRADSGRRYSQERKMDLFGQGQDSVMLQRYDWGLFDIGVVRAFRQSDTLLRLLEIGAGVDSARWCAIYLSDQDRPLSVSGQTSITGNAYLPKSGIRAAYVDNQSYQGSKQMVSGHQYDSRKELPSPQKDRLSLLRGLLSGGLPDDSLLRENREINNDFSQPVRYLNFKKVPHTLRDIRLSGRVIVVSDTTLSIDSTAQLEEVILIAKTIKVGSGFKGRCQLFATDSLIVGANSTFAYPSALCLLQFKSAKGLQPHITLGDHLRFTGTVITWQETPTPLPPMLQIGRESTLNGQIYSSGVCAYKGKLRVNGSLYTTRFLYRNDFTAFENYLINAAIDTRQLSPYYRTGLLLPGSGKKNQIIQWLKAN